jgi:hypothetical protein
VHFVSEQIQSTADPSEQLLAEFIGRWKQSEAAERANYQLFLTELCALLGVPKPEPTRADVSKNAYVFERDVTFQNMDGTTSVGRIDLYKRGCFVLEAKQGSEQATDDDPFELLSKPKKTKKGTAVRGTKGWDDAMVKARGQAEQYARALPTDEGWPPFLIVVDVGHTIELFADFTKSGKTYLPFPDPGSFRIPLDKLTEREQREKLRSVWADPLSLDPSKRSAKVTRELADSLAKLSKSLEASPYNAGRVAQFLMRCLFTMFAEDVDLIPRASFTELLKSLRGEVSNFPDMVRDLWESMDKGTFSPILRQKLRRFNGGLFEDCEALPLSESQLELLIEASSAQWREVEPAIFGTLLERALDPIERHKLGAHYTPRAYVERLVMPTIIEPLRDEWDTVRTAALTAATNGKTQDAIETVREFHRKLCETRVLDPACGTGNFLYVALEHMKRLEGEILNTLRDFGYKQIEIITVDPHQFLGIEVNPRAAAIADLVLWIGYLQWHLRTRDLSQLHEPIIQKFHNIDCRDAVLAWDSMETAKNEKGEVVTRWDGRTMKKHPSTGKDVPDDAARVPVMKYFNARQSEWPEADYICGNPPFVGNKKMRDALSDEYTQALRGVWSSVPETADFVMYWWRHAAEKIRLGRVQRFGFITTNSITQTFNRSVIQSANVTLAFAIPDHPWVDTAGGAAVRVAMTVGVKESIPFGRLWNVVEEAAGDEDVPTVTYKQILGHINSDLTIGVDLTKVLPLKANKGLSFMGMIPLGSGFWITHEEAVQLGLGKVPRLERHIRRYLNGRDLTGNTRGIFALDFFGLSEKEVRDAFPAAYQWILDRVKPQRDQDKRDSRRRNWWLFAESVPKFRNAISGLNRYIGTAETAKHRMFQMIESDVLPDQKIRVVAHSDPLILGVLSSRVHLVWTDATGSMLEDRPVYNNSKCFEPFPFPSLDTTMTAEAKRRVSSLAEQLDVFRKRQQVQYPGLTMTGMYNVMEKLRSGETLTDKEKTIHEQGLVSVLKQIHDDLDAAVFDAYGWPVMLADEEILERLVALNAERAAEEQRGIIRWLRPEFQNPSQGRATQTQLDIEEPEGEGETPTTPGKKTKGTKKLGWPKSLTEQVQAIRQQLAKSQQPVDASELAKAFARADSTRIAEMLNALSSLGMARHVSDGKYVSA